MTDPIREQTREAKKRARAKVADERKTTNGDAREEPLFPSGPQEYGPPPTDANTEAIGAPEIQCKPWWRDPASIPRREFLYSRHYVRKNISASIGAGGRLKTSHALFETVEMAVGRNLTTGEA